jgi:hypothetical protein
MTSVRDGRDRDCLVPLTDRHAGTVWTGEASPSAPERIELMLEEPKPVRCLRLVGLGTCPFRRLARLEILRPGREEWDVACGTHAVTDFFWSGPRPFWGGRRYRTEYRLGDETVRGLRIVLMPLQRETARWRIMELQVFGPGPEQASPAESMPELVALVRERGLSRLYTDRWEANHIVRALGDSVRLELHAGAFPQAVPLEPALVELSPGVGLVVAAHDVGVTRRTLSMHGFPLRETAVGPWVLFDLPEDAAGAKPASGGSLYWTGFNLLTGPAAVSP